MKRAIAIIPARYASTRFPGKPLADINGKSMIQRVYEQVAKCKSLSFVVVATDDQRIADAVKAFGGKVVMTNPDHPSGTDRCFEAYQICGVEADIVVNVQGDEPFVDPSQLDCLIQLFDKHNVAIATLVKPIDNIADLHNPNKVKAVLSQTGAALYFSRQAIPYLRGVEEQMWLKKHCYYKHLGLYAYTPDTLSNLVQLPIADLEQAESLEQLRWLANDFQIHTAVTHLEALAVDTPEDLNKLLLTLAKDA